VAMRFPDFSLQSLIGFDWWEDDRASLPARGSLVYAHIYYPEKAPSQLVPIGRENDDDHSRVEFRIEQLSTKTDPTRFLPVAALPTLEKGERFIVNRGKRRLALILSDGGAGVPATLTREYPKGQASPVYLLAPFYGTESGQGRGGFPPALVERIQACEYPQWLWDHPPHDTGCPSVLRLDHVQCTGKAGCSITPTGFRLSDSAFEVLREWYAWLLSGEPGPREGSDLGEVRELLLGELDKA
jgi:hypothetical protein